MNYRHSRHLDCSKHFCNATGKGLRSCSRVCRLGCVWGLPVPFRPCQFCFSRFFFHFPCQMPCTGALLGGYSSVSISEHCKPSPNAFFSHSFGPSRDFSLWSSRSSRFCLSRRNFLPTSSLEKCVFFLSYAAYSNEGEEEFQNCLMECYPVRR